MRSLSSQKGDCNLLSVLHCEWYVFATPHLSTRAFESSPLAVPNNPRGGRSTPPPSVCVSPPGDHPTPPPPSLFRLRVTTPPPPPPSVFRLRVTTPPPLGVHRFGGEVHTSLPNALHAAQERDSQSQALSPRSSPHIIGQMNF